MDAGAGSRVKLAHFYHAWADGDWAAAIGEHMAALTDSEFDSPVHVGCVGTPHNCMDVKRQFDVLHPATEWWEARTGWEQVTIKRLHKYAQNNDGAVMYAHTKGSANYSPFQEVWRGWMTKHVVLGWRECVGQLRHGIVNGADLVGCHWLTREEFPQVVVDTSLPMMGGNFWIATCQYLRSLPPVGMEARHEAESWVGLGDPKVLDLSPGWPGSWPYPAWPRPRLVAG